ncbi:MAG: glutamyl-tRNA reductase [Planctomycetota bacterium]|jgi:glutamyl-tRNA reductase
MKIWMTGLDFETAPIEVRESLAFTREESMQLLPALLKKAGLWEAVLLFTCNRTELYLVEGDAGCAQDPAEILMRLKGLVPSHRYWQRREGKKALEHLFCVAAGLRSMVKGETQVLGQVKEAYRTAVDAGATGPYLNRVFHAAIRAGKRVRAETSISEGAVSVSQAAVEMACEEGPKALRDATVLVIGAGQMAELVVKHLAAKGTGAIRIANRTRERAERLAARFGCTAHGLEVLEDLLESADIVISAASCQGYLVSGTFLSSGGKDRYLVDMGIPRTLDPGLAKVRGVVLRNIDALNGRVRGNRKHRETEAIRGAALVGEEVAEILKWIEARKGKSTIQALAGYMESIRARELMRACKGADPAEVERLEKLSTHIIKRVSQPLIKKLNDTRSEGDREALETYLRLLREVYSI